ncbi:MAG: DUF5034 domain-containing protein [Prevotellaceae bacterium]|jgi:hypothetical protein|nr:DUF5034 domain-containing protein [Prevotellaceae bacterium]
MRPFFAQLFACLLLLMLTVQCNRDRGEEQINRGETGYADFENAISRIELRSMDNSGNLPVPVVDNRCPRRAYMLQVVPVLEVSGHKYNSIMPPIKEAHITTLTDFDGGNYPAGSVVDELFYQENSMYIGISTPIRFVDAGEYYTLVLMHYPAAGTYRFRVEFLTETGQTIVADTETLTFY